MLCARHWVRPKGFFSEKKQTKISAVFELPFLCEIIVTRVSVCSFTRMRNILNKLGIFIYPEMMSKFLGP